MTKRQSAPILGLFFLLLFVIPCSANTTLDLNNEILTVASIFYFIVCAAISKYLVSKNIPHIVGLIIGGIIYGNIEIFDPIIKAGTLDAFALIGSMMLLFYAGLESDIAEMRKQLKAGMTTATIGVVVPLILISIVARYIFSGGSEISFIFFGATFVATSVAVTAAVFKANDGFKMREAKIVMNAAVIDDIMGIIVLAVVVKLGLEHLIRLDEIIEIAILSLCRSLAFIAVSFFGGRLLAPKISCFLKRIDPGSEMKFYFALIFAFFWALFGKIIFDQEMIIGAFAGGLVLAPAYFSEFYIPKMAHKIRKLASGTTTIDEELRTQILDTIERYSHLHIEDLINPLVWFFGAVFFGSIGAKIRINEIATISWPGFLCILILAIVSKIISGFGAPKETRRIIVGWAMVARGEVGMIFASIGYSMGVLNMAMFTMAICVLLLTTIIGPIGLNLSLAKYK